MLVCVRVCIECGVCMYVCADVRQYVYMYVPVYVGMCVCVYAFGRGVRVCMYGCVPALHGCVCIGM